MLEDNYLIYPTETILVTGAAGFIGKRVVSALLRYGFSNIRCFVRQSSNVSPIIDEASKYPSTRLEFLKGNLLSNDDCLKATEDIPLILHLAAGIDKSFSGSFMNSVVTTRNLLDAAVQNRTLKRIVNVSSIAVYSNKDTHHNRPLDETCEVDPNSFLRYEPYVYGKCKQDELLLQYAKIHKIPYVIVRPGDVYGPGKRKISGRAGIDTFGFFLHLGGPNPLPLTFVDNCAEAIVLAGIRPDIDGEIFNIVDDNPPTSKQFLQSYKAEVNQFRSLYLPYPLFFLFCYFWEKYSEWSHGQLPPIFNRRRCRAHWKPVTYSNRKIRQLLGWRPNVSRDDALNRYFEFMRNG